MNKQDKCAAFFPISREEARAGGLDTPDFVYVCGDAYVDHPSFGCAVICRYLEAHGFTCAIIPQPDWRTTDAFKEFGRPKLGFLVSSGNIDSMVAHYSVSKHKRKYDYYSPAGKFGLRPDRAVIVYCNMIRQAYGDVPIIIGGLEASLRRFAHYDYWSDTVRRSVLVDSRADIVSYGMGEKTILELARLLERGVPVKKIRGVRGTAYLVKSTDKTPEDAIFIGEYDELKQDKKAYANAFKIQYENQDAISGKPLCEGYGDKVLVCEPPQYPLEQKELDKVYSLPYARAWHPSYDSLGGVPALEEVKFSVTHNRGCFGECNFCALTFHQGRAVRSRSKESVLAEVEKITHLPGFKGYIHDIGGPTANFRAPACEKQVKYGVCKDKRCLAPTPCKNLKVDHNEYLDILTEAERIPGVKKVFVRSGIRFDYLMLDKDKRFFRKLVRDHVSGQLKVAPEHCSTRVLNAMGKPNFGVYKAFEKEFKQYSKEAGLEQYLVPYLMSSHPGSKLDDAIELSLFLRGCGMNPEQVQDFYPTPGTVSTVMYYTGIDPLSGKEIFVPTNAEDKRLQRALLQSGKPENAKFLREQLMRRGRSDLIGYGDGKLVPPNNTKVYQSANRPDKKISTKRKPQNVYRRDQNGLVSKKGNTQKRKTR
ncbi:MAG: YgiQ family radical SAM protein [Clostridia bacterium]|nr:YgiQ family radical SAM protein [Clostridia bacterium]